MLMNLRKTILMKGYECNVVIVYCGGLDRLMLIHLSHDGVTLRLC